MSPGKGLWEMESGVKWQESGMECRLAKVTGLQLEIVTVCKAWAVLIYFGTHINSVALSQKQFFYCIAYFSHIQLNKKQTENALLTYTVKKIFLSCQ